VIQGWHRFVCACWNKITYCFWILFLFSRKALLGNANAKHAISQKKKKKIVWYEIPNVAVTL